ncbi:STAS domain-containing protein [Embleya sp. NBC_00896]|uniref:STAS domain-containing protein n=1 Tax=Embleya sp. NBC_00896 TaxID=2975961 RepID=UPI002F90BDD4|nr:STAS domain-containing protein [Embleya sp. NBC_00896]
MSRRPRPRLERRGNAPPHAPPPRPERRRRLPIVRRPYLRLRAAVDGDVARLQVCGEIDLDTAPRLRRALDEVFDSGAGRVHVDMDRVTFCDSTAVHALLYARTRALVHGTSLGLAPGDWVRRVLEITGTADLFTLGPHSEPRDRVGDAAVEDPDDDGPAEAIP